MYFLLILFIGVVSSFVALSLHKFSHAISAFLETDKPFSITTTIVGCVMIVAATYISKFFIRSTSGSGIPYVKIAISTYSGRLTKFQTLFKYLGTLLSLSLGLALGIEGPTSMVAGGIAYILGSKLKLKKIQQKNLTALGAAGGIAAAFNSPIAAVVFTFEEILGKIHAKAIGSIIFVAFVADFMTTQVLGKEQLFKNQFISSYSPINYIFFILIAISSAIIGHIFVKCVYLLKQNNLKWCRSYFHSFLYSIGVFLFIVIASHIDMNLLGSGHDTIHSLISKTSLDIKAILILFIGRFILTSLCYSSGVSGGLFMPVLLLGALFGGSVGSFIQYFAPYFEVAPLNLYMFLGMGSFFTSIIRAPFTSILMIFELTQNYDTVLPLMIVSTTAMVISNHFSYESIYEKVSILDGVVLPQFTEEFSFGEVHVKDIMNKNVESIEEEELVDQAMDFIKKINHHVVPVVHKNLLTGVLSLQDIEKNYENKDKLCVGQVCSKKLITIFSDQSVLLALQKMKKNKISRIIVIDRLNYKRIVGIITASDISTYFNIGAVKKVEKFRKKRKSA